MEFSVHESQFTPDEKVFDQAISDIERASFGILRFP